VAPATASAWHTPFVEAAPAPEPNPPAYTPVDAPMVAPPAVVNPSSVVPAPAPPAGPLPTYGADLRPPAATVPPPAPPSPPPSAATPLAAPTTHPTAGSGGLTNAAPVRPPSTVAPPEASSGMPGQAVAATAGGATVGAVSADATARARLQRIVDAVARQEPQLAWAAGDGPDGTTVLVTDLASGWIPPGISAPAGVTLLQPDWRRGSLNSLLGEVSLAAGYRPTHYIPAEDDPLPTWPRARQVPEIEELTWELNQATHWRDGLPRLAHTLAKAVGAGTGVLDSEIDLLHQELAKVRDQVLASYPKNVNRAAVGNWQLLAAIAALTAGDKRAADYHFAWFKALSRDRSEG
ncbi:MAG TPA: DUF5631 domain-containing protein, partial [Mycobacterium sp.]|nr:DUF5631 domain-containing protein [Mycobacterium sp.]